MYNTKHLFSKTVSIKNHGKVCLDRKAYHDALLVSFTAKTPSTITSYNEEKKYFLHFQMQGMVPLQNYIHILVFCT